MITVYVPDPAFAQGQQTLSIDPRSAIVGEPVANGLVPDSDVLELIDAGVTYRIGRGEHTITVSTVPRSATAGVLDVHNGVLMPAELHSASDGERDRHAAQAKKTNGAAVAEYLAHEDAAATAGVDFDRLDRAPGRTP